MNIGIDVRSLTGGPRTGVGEYTAELVRAIVQKNTEHTYVLFSNAAHGTAVDRSLFPSADHVHYAETHWPNKLLNTCTILTGRPQVDRLIATKLSHSSSSKLDLLFSPNLNITAYSSHLPHLLTIHDLSFDFFPEFFSFKQRLWHAATRPRQTCQRAAAIITPSHNTRRDLIEHYGIAPERVHVLYPGLSPVFKHQLAQLTPTDLVTFRARYKLPARFILFLGTIEPRKNILALVTGFEQFLDQQGGTNRCDLKLVIAGAPGWKNHTLLKRIRTSRYASAINLIGYVPSAAKAPLYRLAEIFVYPSFYEGFGFPVLEALAAGTPVITSARASLGEVGGEAAYYVQPHWPSDIATGIERLTTDTALRAGLIARGYAQVQRFSFAVMADEWLNLAKNIR